MWGRVYAGEKEWRRVERDRAVSRFEFMVVFNVISTGDACERKVRHSEAKRKYSKCSNDNVNILIETEF